MLGGHIFDVHVDMGRWSAKCPNLSTRGRWVDKKRQKSVHVVIEAPLFVEHLNGRIFEFDLKQMYWL